MARKYSRAGIDELEALFKRGSTSRDLLEALAEELAHRSTPRARRLCDSVAQTLAKSAAHRTPDSSRDRGCGSTDGSTNQPKADQHFASGHQPGDTRQWRRATPPGPRQPLANEPAHVLDAWTALEVLSPPPFVRPEDLASGDRRAVARIDQSKLPWEGEGEKARPNTRLYYQVVLGTVRMEPALHALIEVYGDSRPERPAIRGEAVLAVVTLDKRGRLVESPSVSISSFGWGVTAALEGDLPDLSAWPAVETGLVHGVDRQLRALCGLNDDESETELRPVSARTLSAVYDGLVQQLRLPIEFLEPPRFAIRRYEYYKNPNPPEPLLLNSFFLKDLAFARNLVTEGKAPQNLSKYLGQTKPAQRLDLLCSPSALESAVAPKQTPLARWPSRGRHPLVLLQQAAVNAAFSETECGGILGINGPPGTGKSTLLRDVLAGVITARAEALTKFDDPQDAFTHSGEKLKAGNAWLHLYKLDSTLRGFELLVASSNNRAVENVSGEVPAISAVAADAAELRYFKTASDALHQADTWGLIAAVLGNAQRRGHFRKTFWWDEDHGFSAYLAAINGGRTEIETHDDQAGSTGYRLPKIVSAEDPPSTHEIALQRWRKARDDFRTAADRARVWQTWLESVRAIVLQMPVLREAAREASRAVDNAVADLRQSVVLAEAGARNRVDKDAAHDTAAQRLAAHLATKPGFFARLFSIKTARAWRNTRRALTVVNATAEAAGETAKIEEQRLNEIVQHASATLKAAQAKHTTATIAERTAAEKLTEAKDKFGAELGDQGFFERDHSDKHVSTPWFPAQAQRIRDDVFINAIKLHRSFIDAAAKPLRHNLGAFINTLAAAPFPTAAKEALLPDLWSSLFLVVPLISTTFASVNRMLGRLPVATLGWLLVDEAGQASPQSIVGALLRSQRVVVVGDPAQVEPVVMLPDALTTAICLRFGVDPDTFGAPAASIQSLADAASTYQSDFTTRAGSRTVGAPLLVHRRCAEPMFSIANAIAYSGLMVPAKQNRHSPIAVALGPSRWFDVRGSGEDKWCRTEGEHVVQLLTQLADAGVKPNLYIITPFVIVQDRMREMIRSSGVLTAWEVDDHWRWTAERVGTIHTVQGREAEAVLLVLGAPLPQQTGARGWAGGKPNLLNVAVTRAQEVIYVIGNFELWKSVGVFAQLANRLPVDDAGFVM